RNWLACQHIPQMSGALLAAAGPRQLGHAPRDQDPHRATPPDPCPPDALGASTGWRWQVRPEQGASEGRPSLRRHDVVRAVLSQTGCASVP
ncbi:unnamed protein product, partial [Polarella glacialis]